MYVYNIVCIIYCMYNITMLYCKWYIIKYCANCYQFSIQQRILYVRICSVVMCSNFRPCSLLCVLLNSADTPSSCGDSLLPRQSLLRCLQPSVLDACLLCTSRLGSDATSTRKMQHHFMPHHSHPLQFFSAN